MKRFLAAVLVATTLSLGTVTLVRADDTDTEATQYEDAFSNPLRLAYYMIYPVGFSLEWLVMRPLHYVISRPYLDKFFGYTAIGEEGTTRQMGEHM
jgi:hypothetical protein